MTDSLKKGISILALVMGFVWVFSSLMPAPLKAATVNDKYQHDIVFYSASWCGYCSKLRNDFRKKNVRFLELDVETSFDVQKEFKDLGGRGVPMVVAHGEVVRGYNPNAIMNIISENQPL